MKLIDADALDVLLKDCIARYKFVTEPIGIIRSDEINIIRNLIIEQMPTIDAVPVVHGTWVHLANSNCDDFYRCSECKDTWLGIGGYNYCPNCGAKMDGERREKE